ncbi:ATP-binding protein [Streptomyces scopuliridis]|uniref:sensor histidine kinase n=1 Tax=Streptomyces scopuliridis TaxID=452529 RepID=UPI002DD8D249|nr:sensor histidine kinase [Streptomyces scopuliridis]WSB34381.1 ATP-binding protein [Streptomyces scopuliridis]
MGTHLRFAPEILARLGEELIPHPDLGVMELVRNAYDADATVCHVTLANASRPGGTLVVSDNGHGMTVADIEGGFLRIGRSTKAGSPMTSHFGRRKVGEKGLGRLASLRLGQEVEVITRPAQTPGVAHRLIIDWSAYASVDSVDDVELEVQTFATPQKPGTTMIVKYLREGFEVGGIKRLARALLLLSGGFTAVDNPAGKSGNPTINDPDWEFTDEQDPGFTVSMEAPEYETLAQAVNEGYFQEYEFKLVAELDSDGQAHATLTDWRGEILGEADHDEVASPPGRKSQQIPERFHAPAARFELWMLLRDSDSFKRRNSARTLTEVSSWLDIVGGVHLFHRGLRTHPYGDAGHDWVGIDAARNQDPQHRPNNRNSVGRVIVEDPDDSLIPKTDRMGFQENLAFTELRAFARCAHDWAAAVRKQRWAQERSGETAVVREQKKSDRSEAEKVLRRLPLAQAAPLRKALDTSDRLIESLERDRLLYRALATVGISTAVFAHESLNTSGGLESDLELLEEYARLLLDESSYADNMAEPLDRAQRSAASIHSFAKLPLRMLRRGKRKLVAVDVNEVCLDFVEMFGGYLKDWQIDIQMDLDSSPATVRSTVADVESLYANLVINAARAFGRSGTSDNGRVVRISTSQTSDRVVIDVADSGPGISGVEIARIWDPGEGSDEDGTGLGLTIVKDVVADLHGKKRVLEDGELAAVPHGELGGAQFTIRLPLYRARMSGAGAHS